MASKWRHDVSFYAKICLGFSTEITLCTYEWTAVWNLTVRTGILVTRRKKILILVKSSQSLRVANFVYPQWRRPVATPLIIIIIIIMNTVCAAATGCADYKADSDSVWVRYSSDRQTAEVGCHSSTSTKTWQLVCRAGEWTGHVDDCSPPGTPTRPPL